MRDLKRTVKYWFGATVWYTTDLDYIPRVVTGYMIRHGMTVYIISYAGQESYAYEYELTDINPALIDEN